MDIETALDWANRVEGAFGKGYTAEQLLEIREAFQPLSDADGAKLFSTLKQTVKESYRVNVRDIDKAKAQAGIRGEAREGLRFEAVQWECQACGRGFRFHASPARDSEYMAVFSFCPHCGFIPRVAMRIDGDRVGYVRDQNAIAALSVSRDGKPSIIADYRAKRGEFFDAKKDRDGEMQRFKDREIVQDLAEKLRYE